MCEHPSASVKAASSSAPPPYIADHANKGRHMARSISRWSRQLSNEETSVVASHTVTAACPAVQRPRGCACLESMRPSGLQYAAVW